MRLVFKISDRASGGVNICAFQRVIRLYLWSGYLFGLDGSRSWSRTTVRLVVQISVHFKELYVCTCGQDIYLAWTGLGRGDARPCVSTVIDIGLIKTNQKVCNLTLFQSNGYSLNTCAFLGSLKIATWFLAKAVS